MAVVRAVRRRSLAVGLLPFAYFASLMPAGVPRAQGCSGGEGGTGEPPSGVLEIDLPYESELEPSEPVPVGADGFFAIRVQAKRVEADEVAPALAIHVEDEAGIVIPGTLQRIHYDGSSGRTKSEFGWHTEQVLPVGELLTAVVAASGSNGEITKTFPFVVSDESATLAFAEVALRDWTVGRRDYGSTWSCESASSCEEPPADFGSEYGTVFGARVEARVAPPIMVAWQLWFQSVGDVWTSHDYDGAYSLYGSAQRGNELLFHDSASEYCVRVGLTDWRTGEDFSEIVCEVVPENPEVAEWDGIHECADPPPGLEARWCRAWAGTLRAAEVGCEALLGGAGGEGGAAGRGESAGDAGESSSSGGESSEAGSGGAPFMPPEVPPRESGAGSGGKAGADNPASSAGAESQPARTSTDEGGCGCRMSGRSERSGSLAALAILGLFLLRSPSRIRASARRPPRGTSCSG